MRERQGLRTGGWGQREGWRDRQRGVEKGTESGGEGRRWAETEERERERGVRERDRKKGGERWIMDGWMMERGERGGQRDIRGGRDKGMEGEKEREGERGRETGERERDGES